jgi:hypothetical protein
MSESKLFNYIILLSCLLRHNVQGNALLTLHDSANMVLSHLVDSFPQQCHPKRLHKRCFGDAPGRGFVTPLYGNIGLPLDSVRWFTLILGIKFIIQYNLEDKTLPASLDSHLLSSGYSV